MNNEQSSSGKNIRSISGYLIVYAATAAVPFITMPIFTRLIAPEDYGRMALAMIYGTIISGLSNLGTSVAYNRQFFKPGQDKRSISTLMLTSVLFTLCLFLVFISLTILLRTPISILVTQSPGNGNVIVLACIVCYLNLLYNEFCLNYWRNNQKVRGYMVYALIHLALNTGLSLFLVIGMHFGITGILLANAISSGCIIIFFLIKSLEWKKPWDWHVLFTSLKISYPLTPQVFIGVLNTQSDKYIVKIFGEMKNVGVYDIGKRIAAQVFVVMTALQNVFLPGVYKRLFSSEEKIKQSVGPYLTPFFFLTIALSLCFALFTEELVLILLPPAFHEVIRFLIPLSLAYAPMFFGKITGQQLIFAKKLHISMVLVIINSIITTGVNIPFIFFYGAMGAAIGNMLASIITNGISLLVAQRFCKINWEWNKIIVLMVLLFISAAGAFLLLSLNIAYVWRLLYKACFLGIFCFCGNRFGIITKASAKQIIKALTFWKRTT